MVAGREVDIGVCVECREALGRFSQPGGKPKVREGQRHRDAADGRCFKLFVIYVGKQSWRSSSSRSLLLSISMARQHGEVLAPD